MPRTTQISACVAASLLLGAAAAASGPPVGALTPLRGSGACIYAPNVTDEPDPLTGVCTRGTALTSASDLAVSPDGRNVYVVGAGDDAVAAFQRNPESGRVSQLSGSAACIGVPDDQRPCAPGNLAGVASLAISPDGTSIYAAAPTAHSLSLLLRDPQSGALKEAEGTGGCISDELRSDLCTLARALVDPTTAAVSPDGRNVYVTSPGSNALLVFTRDAATGRLAQLEGRQGCVIEPLDDEEAVPQESCGTAVPLDEPYAVAVSPEGRHVYVASRGTVTVFARDRATGALEQLRGPDGCLASRQRLEFAELPCPPVNGLGAPSRIAVSRDGKSVYVASAIIVTADSEIDSGIAAFTRNPESGTLAQPAGEGGCATVLASDGCRKVAALQGSQFDQRSLGLALSPDGRSVYLAALEADALTVFGRDGNTGALQPVGGAFACVGSAPSGCVSAPAMDGANAVAVSAGGSDVYVASYVDAALAAFTRTEAEVRLTARLSRARTGGSGSATVRLTSRRICWSIAARSFGAIKAAHIHRRNGAIALRLRPAKGGCSSLTESLATSMQTTSAAFTLDIHGAGKSVLAGILRRSASG